MKNEPRLLTRRRLLATLGGIAATSMLAGWTTSRQLQWGSESAAMKPGDYIWAPERSPVGEIITIVSLPEQRAHVYRGGREIAISTCSTGRKGHRTPTGVFSVLQKDRDHVSSTYKGAKMPYMERLTWSGIALHAGNLPGYPASHGCIRLPLEFAQKLYLISHLGMVVIIADGHSEPTEVVHPGIFLPAYTEDEARQHVAAVAGKQRPAKARHEAPHRPAKILISVADKSITVFEDGHLRARGPAYVSRPSVPIGNHTFVLKAAHANSRAFIWTAVAHHADGPGRQRPAASEASILNRITTDDRTAQAIQSVMHPGVLMFVTDAAAPDTTRSERSFVIASHHEPADWRTEVFRN
jgi:hypothetical protein